MPNIYILALLFAEKFGKPVAFDMETNQVVFIHENGNCSPFKLGEDGELLSTKEYSPTPERLITINDLNNKAKVQEASLNSLNALQMLQNNIAKKKHQLWNTVGTNGTQSEGKLGSNYHQTGKKLSSNWKETGVKLVSNWFQTEKEQEQIVHETLPRLNVTKLTTQLNQSLIKLKSEGKLKTNLNISDKKVRKILVDYPEITPISIPQNVRNNDTEKILIKTSQNIFFIVIAILCSTKQENSHDYAFDLYEISAIDTENQKTRALKKNEQKLIARLNLILGFEKGRNKGKKDLEKRRLRKEKRQKIIMLMVAILIFGSIISFLINSTIKNLSHSQNDDVYCSNENTIVLDSTQIKIIVSETNRKVGEWRTNKIIETLYMQEMNEAEAFATVDSLIVYAWYEN